MLDFLRCHANQIICFAVVAPSHWIFWSAGVLSMSILLNTLDCNEIKFIWKRNMDNAIYNIVGFKQVLFFDLSAAFPIFLIIE